jgi:1,4-alpha-glucan branching enzyme
LAQNGARCPSGHKYRKIKSGGPDDLYDPVLARSAAGDHARFFLENTYSRMTKAAGFMKEMPVSLCAFNADDFGRQWYEGPYFLETLFRLAASYRELQFMTPSEYLYQQPVSAFEVSLPEFSSWGDNGYAEIVLDSSNDWIYRHINRAVERMIELAERFSEDTGLKERALNQAAREILLAQSSDWPAMLHRRENTEYARCQVENALRNFTTIYEALGSGHISTEWLTSLESRHNFFPRINYRVFMKKR